MKQYQHVDNSFELEFSKFEAVEITKRILAICNTLNNYTNGTNVTHSPSVQIKAMELLEKIYFDMEGK